MEEFVLPHATRGLLPDVNVNKSFVATPFETSFTPKITDSDETSLSRNVDLVVLITSVRSIPLFTRDTGKRGRTKKKQRR